ncbi:MAG TPA: ATP-binding protein [Steroidobacteraceae bacterium]|nr:ATP-binding protein [Steroidobacteraceae bacterium]
MIDGTDSVLPVERAPSAKAYLAALESYLKGDGEPALQRAYEMGRTALAQGVGLLEFARIHHTCLETLLARGATTHQRETILAGAADFLAECISPYEMTYRGFRDANIALRRFNSVLEREAKRIAHSLHDEAGQLLVAVYIALANLARDVPQAAGHVANITGLLDQIEAELRRLSHELTPAILKDFGVTPALRYLAEGVSRRSGLRIVIEGTPEGRLPEPVEAALYRLAQESLTNAVRHARATTVTIRFRHEVAAIACHIRDDGVGFDAKLNAASGGERGFGLIGIRERAGSLGGTLEIKSAAGAGTEVIMSIPLES